MDSQNSGTNQNRQAGAQDNPSNLNPTQSNNIQPIKDIPTKTRVKTTTKPRIKRNRALLEQRFPLEYIAQGMNATRAYKALKPHVINTTANVEGTKTLAKPSVQQALQELLQENNLTVGETMKIHRRNLLQKKNLHVSQTAVQDVYKLSGLLNNRDNNTQVNIAMVIKSKE